MRVVVEVTSVFPRDVEEGTVPAGTGIAQGSGTPLCWERMIVAACSANAYVGA